MIRVRFVIQPHSEGGYAIFRERQLAGFAVTLEKARAFAAKLAAGESRAGRIGRVVHADLGGNVVAGSGLPIPPISTQTR
jgi:hypothetical protein